jgi:sarcosine oxidase, subunit gamma
MNAPISSFAPGLMAETSAARVSVAAPVARWSLRAREGLAALGDTLGLVLPPRIGQRAAAGEVQVICLGPDEWTIHAPEARAPRIEAGFAALYATHPHSLVNVSGRELSLVLEGPRAAELLTLGCARDIDSIAPGEGRRTNFDGVTVLLWRDGPTRFRMDVWHSFVPHVFHLLDTGCRELAAEPL